MCQGLSAPKTDLEWKIPAPQLGSMECCGTGKPHEDTPGHQKCLPCLVLLPQARDDACAGATVSETCHFTSAVVFTASEKCLFLSKMAAPSGSDTLLFILQGDARTLLFSVPGKQQDGLLLWLARRVSRRPKGPCCVQGLWRGGSRGSPTAQDQDWAPGWDPGRRCWGGSSLSPSCCSSCTTTHHSSAVLLQHRCGHAPPRTYRECRDIKRAYASAAAPPTASCPACSEPYTHPAPRPFCRELPCSRDRLGTKMQPAWPELLGWQQGMLRDKSQKVSLAPQSQHGGRELVFKADGRFAAGS